MKLAFFISSIGDSDLALATASKLVNDHNVTLVPLTQVALDRCQGFKDKDKVSLRPLLSTVDEARWLVESQGIEHAYVGVPSSDAELPYLITQALDIPCTLAYEYMFKSAEHKFWPHLKTLATKPRLQYAVPLAAAKEDILEGDAKAKVHIVGHLSLDRRNDPKVDKAALRQALALEEKQESIFISGSTQPKAVDMEFLEALLEELATGQYPHLQLRVGIHPGIKDLDDYLSAILNICQRYPKMSDQFKIIMPDKLREKISIRLEPSEFILRSNLTGAEAALACDKICQAVPGALTNEAAFQGKPAFYFRKAKPYLLKEWFSESVSSFFKASAGTAHEKSELGLDGSVDECLSRLIIS